MHEPHFLTPVRLVLIAGMIGIIVGISNSTTLVRVITVVVMCACFAAAWWLSKLPDHDAKHMRHKGP